MSLPRARTAARPGVLATLAVSGALLAGPAGAAERFVAPGGSADGSGTKESPWDIASALAGRQKVAPGDTVWLRGGTYRARQGVGGNGFVVALAGRAGAPVVVAGYPGERATIDGGLSVQPPATHLWVRDLEILVSEPRPDRPVPPDPTYRNVGRPWGGLNVYTGTGCRYVNLVIHDNCQGVSFWTPARDSALYGCLIYDNGWRGTDRGHGHAVYAQNKDGTKTIADCIMTGGFGYSMHAYGSRRADVDNFLLAGNIAYGTGPFLAGGGKPSRHIRVLDNCLYGVSMRVGYTAPYNHDCEVRGNVVVNGSIQVTNYRELVKEGNLELGASAVRPAGVRAVWRPNRYDDRRAHLAVFNWDRRSVVEVSGGGFLKTGQRYRLMDPRDFYGEPRGRGTYDGHALRVSVVGEFAVFVCLKEP
jgi:hypothetical protein